MTVLLKSSGWHVGEWQGTGRPDHKVLRPVDLEGPVEEPFTALPGAWIDRPIVEILRDVARHGLAGTAVRDGEVSLTYSELLAAIDRLAAAADREARGGGVIGILVPNNACHPVAMLASLASNRAFVPFDLHQPAGRLRDMIEAACLDAILVDGRGADVDEIVPAGLPRIDVRTCLAGPPCEGTVPDTLGPDSPAAILHTSGSTGRPKAVVISQASLLQRVLQHVNASHITAADQLCPLSSPSTISGTREQLAALLTGATLHVLEPRRLGLAEMRRAMAARRITLVYAVPALLRAILHAEGSSGDFASLRVVRLGGEAVLWRDVALLREVLPRSCHVQVGFSSTETPGLQWFVPPGFVPSGAAVPLGYELEGTDVAVLDEAGLPVAAGEIGELEITGRFVALGHWQGGACVPGPFRPSPDGSGRRTLQTGDLVRRRADGLYAYAGRKDRQVKIRGQRVDPTEVEAVLHGVPGVTDAAVMAVADGDRVVLVGFVQAEAGRGPGALQAEAGAALRSLPEAMRPQRLHVVPAIPRLPSAKPDAAGLRELDLARQRAVPADDRAAPLDDDWVGRAVARAWLDTLGTLGGSADTMWSEAGGDSLRLLELALRIEREIRRPVPLELLDIDMRLGALTAAIATLLTSGSASVSEDARPVVFFFPGIEDDTVAQARFRHALRDAARFEAVTYPDWQAMATQGGGMERVVDLACARILEHATDGPVCLAGYSFGAVVALALASRLVAAGRPVAWLAVFDTNLEDIRQAPDPEPGTRRGGATPIATGLMRPAWRRALRRLTTRTVPGSRMLALRLPAVSRDADVQLRRELRRDLAHVWLNGRERAPVDVRTILFRTDDHDDEAARDLGWSGVSSTVDVHAADGGHLTMFWPPYSVSLSQRFRSICFPDVPPARSSDASQHCPPAA